MFHLGFLCEAALGADVSFLEPPLGALGNEFMSWRVIQGHSLFYPLESSLKDGRIPFPLLRCAGGLISLFNGPPHLSAFSFVSCQFSVLVIMFLFSFQQLVSICSEPEKE